MFLAFFSLAVIGGVLLLTVIAFYNKKDSADIQQSNRRSSNVPGTTRQRNADAPIASGESAASPDIAKNGEGKRGYVPVIQEHKKIPGIGEHELVHFIGSGALFFIETETDLDGIDIVPDELTQVLSGDLVLTSKRIIVYNEGASKKITISSIAQHRFVGPYLIIKRKRVKKKTDIIEISQRPVEFSYILHTLL